MCLKLWDNGAAMTSFDTKGKFMHIFVQVKELGKLEQSMERLIQGSKSN